MVLIEFIEIEQGVRSIIAVQFLVHLNRQLIDDQRSLMTNGHWWPTVIEARSALTKVITAQHITTIHYTCHLINEGEVNTLE